MVTSRRPPGHLGEPRYGDGRWFDRFCYRYLSKDVVMMTTERSTVSSDEMWRYVSRLCTSIRPLDGLEVPRS